MSEVTTLDLTLIQSQAISLAKLQSPLEFCAYVLKLSDGSIRLYPCVNTHPSPTEAFAIDTQWQAEAETLGEIVGVVHSHTNTETIPENKGFSLVDRESCNLSGVPWMLVTLPDEQIQILQPSSDVTDLLGRPWVYGMFDCYGLVRDIYRSIGIELRNYPRSTEFEWNTDPTWNLYEDNFEREGFIEVPKLGSIKKYDLALMRLESDKTNHAGVIMNPDKNEVWHHVINRLSSRDTLAGYWWKYTVKILRHKTLI